jgi:PRTRC genetic system protein C
MALEVTALPREFSFNGVKLPDPNPDCSIEQVRDLYVSSYPELATAAVEGPEATADGTMKIIFRRSVGSKG